MTSAQKMARWKYALLLVALGALAAVSLLSGCGSSSSTPNAFVGSLKGTYTGTESGTWSGIVGLNESMHITVVSPNAGTLTGTGRFTVGGDMNATCSGTGAFAGVTATWTGTWTLAHGSISGSGTWSETGGGSGTWQGAGT
jgi:hypothetical protein